MIRPQPPKPKLRKTDAAPADQVADRAIVSKQADPRLFELPLSTECEPSASRH